MYNFKLKEEISSFFFSSLFFVCLVCFVLFIILIVLVFKEEAWSEFMVRSVLFVSDS